MIGDWSITFNKRSSEDETLAACDHRYGTEVHTTPTTEDACACGQKTATLTQRQNNVKASLIG